MVSLGKSVVRGGLAKWADGWYVCDMDGMWVDG